MSRISCAAAMLFLCFSSAAAGQDARDRITINGFGSLEFEKQFQKNGFGDAKGSFDNDVLGIAVNIYLNDRTRLSLESDWEHGTATGLSRGSLNLEYGFVEYTLAEWLKVRAGKFLVPFGYYNEIHNVAYTFETVKLASPLSNTVRVARGAYRFYPRHAVGIAFHGDSTIGGKNVDYDFLISNGEQTNTNPFEFDDNSFKAVAARVRLDPAEKLRVGTSFYYDEVTERGFDRLIAQAVELEFNWKALRVLSEACIGWKRRTTGGSFDQFGWYLQAAYRFKNRLAPYSRFEYVDFLDSPGDQGFNLITGLNYEVNKNLYLKLENNHFWGGPKNGFATLPGRGYDELKTAIVFGF